MMLLKEILLLKDKIEEAYFDFKEQNLVNQNFKKEIDKLINSQKESLEKINSLESKLKASEAQVTSLKGLQIALKEACVNISKEVVTVSKDLNLISVVLSQMLSGRSYSEIILDINKMLVEDQGKEGKAVDGPIDYEGEIEDTITEEEEFFSEDACQEFNASCNYIFELIDDEKPKCTKKVYH